MYQTWCASRSSISVWKSFWNCLYKVHIWTWSIFRLLIYIILLENVLWLRGFSEICVNFGTNVLEFVWMKRTTGSAQSNYRLLICQIWLPSAIHVSRMRPRLGISRLWSGLNLSVKFILKTVLRLSIMMANCGHSFQVKTFVSRRAHIKSTFLRQMIILNFWGNLHSLSKIRAITHKLLEKLWSWLGRRSFKFSC